MTITATSKQVRDALLGTMHRVTLSNGREILIQRCDAVSTMGLPGWHLSCIGNDIEHSFLGDTKAEAIAALVLRENRAAAAAAPAPAAAPTMTRARYNELREMLRSNGNYAQTWMKPSEYDVMRPIYNKAIDADDLAERERELAHTRKAGYHPVLWHPTPLVAERVARKLCPSVRFDFVV